MLSNAAIGDEVLVSRAMPRYCGEPDASNDYYFNFGDYVHKVGYDVGEWLSVLVCARPVRFVWHGSREVR